MGGATGKVGVGGGGAKKGEVSWSNNQQDSTRKARNSAHSHDTLRVAVCGPSAPPFPTSVATEDCGQEKQSCGAAVSLRACPFQLGSWHDGRRRVRDCGVRCVFIEAAKGSRVYTPRGAQRLPLLTVRGHKPKQQHEQSCKHLEDREADALSC